MASAEALAAGFDIEVAYCPGPGQVDVVPLHCVPGTTLAEAVQRSGLLQRHGLGTESPPGLEGLRLGVWGKLREPGTLLRARDRVEIYRPLKVDPKEARRQRYQRHRERQAAR